MKWLTEKKQRRVALVAGVLGTLNGLVLPEELRASAAQLVEMLCKLFVLW